MDWPGLLCCYDRTGELDGVLDRVKTNIITNPSFKTLPDIQFVRKTADETVNNSNVYQDDNELLFPVNASEVWYFQFFILKYNAGGAAQTTKFQLTAPAGSTGYWYHDEMIGDLTLHTAVTPNPFPSAFNMQANAGGTLANMIKGVIINGATAGSVTLQWAQGVAEAVNHTVKANSFLIAQRLN